MNYFKTLGLVFGLAAFLKPFYMHLIPWDEKKFLEKAYSTKRPGWVIPVALLGLSLAGFTWYKEFTTQIQYSLVITIMFSLTSVKAILLVFNYPEFQKWVAEMLSKDKGRKVVVVDILAGIFGLVLIVLSFLLL